MSKLFHVSLHQMHACMYVCNTCPITEQLNERPCARWRKVHQFLGVIVIYYSTRHLIWFNTGWRTGWGRVRSHFLGNFLRCVGGSSHICCGRCLNVRSLHLNLLFFWNKVYCGLFLISLHIHSDTGHSLDEKILCLKIKE